MALLVCVRFGLTSQKQRGFIRGGDGEREGAGGHYCYSYFMHFLSFLALFVFQVFLVCVCFSFFIISFLFRVITNMNIADLNCRGTLVLVFLNRV